MAARNNAGAKPIVVVTEPLAQTGIAVLLEAGLQVHEAAGKSDDQIHDLLSNAQALIVRSKTRVNAAMLNAAPQLRVVGRAGVGVDSIDIDAATRHGILVLNTPEASTIATCEHTIAMMLALGRHLAAGFERVRDGRWSSQGLTGSELAGKTLGIIGLGRIGAAVASRTKAFGMTILGHDAVISEARAESLGVKLVSLDELLRLADLVTIHVPLTTQTRNMIGARELSLMKPTSRLINCARGGLVVESDLLAALESGRLAGAALDVVSEEPPAEMSPLWKLLRHPKVVATPHLGGSTAEAQERIAVDLCKDVAAVLRGAPPSGAVNAPVTAPAEVKPFVELAHRLGRALPQLSQGEALSNFSLILEGELAEYDSLPFHVAFLVGLLPYVTDTRLSAVNALDVAKELGISVEALGAACERGFSKAITIRTSKTSLTGTIIHGSQPRFIDLNGFEIDSAPVGHMLFTRHRDVPGIVGKVGTILGEAQINISNMQVSRDAEGAAIMLLGIDRTPEVPILESLRSIPNVASVHAVEL